MATELLHPIHESEMPAELLYTYFLTKHLESNRLVNELRQQPHHQSANVKTEV